MGLRKIAFCASAVAAALIAAAAGAQVKDNNFAEAPPPTPRDDAQHEEEEASESLESALVSFQTAPGTTALSLDLAGRGLQGTIPASKLLPRFARLSALDLSTNALRGSIPSSLGKLTGLEILSLGSNRLQGTIPSSLGRVDHLRELDLSYNRLQGSLPREFTSESTVNEEKGRPGTQTNADMHCQRGLSCHLEKLNLASNRGLRGDIFPDDMARALASNANSMAEALEVSRDSMMDMKDSKHGNESVSMSQAALLMVNVFHTGFGQLARAELQEKVQPWDRLQWLSISNTHIRLNSSAVLPLKSLEALLASSMLQSSPCHLFRRLLSNWDSFTRAAPADRRAVLEDLSGALPWPPCCNRFDGFLPRLRLLDISGNGLICLNVSKHFFPSVASLNLSGNQLEHTTLDPTLFDVSVLDVRANDKLQPDRDELERLFSLTPRPMHMDLLRDGAAARYECRELQPRGNPAAMVLVNPESFAPQQLCRCKEGNKGSAANCTPCAVGYFSEQAKAWPRGDTGALSCAACAEGSFADAAGASSCKSCGGRAGSAWSPTGASSTEQCSCNRRWFSVQQQEWNSTAELECLHCRELASRTPLCRACTGSHLIESIFKCDEVNRSLQNASVQEGFWRPQDNPNAVPVFCGGLHGLGTKRRGIAAAACRGGEPGEDHCHPGYAGTYCLECSDDAAEPYFMRGFRCQRCQPFSQLALILAVAGVLLASLVLVFFSAARDFAKAKVAGVRSPPSISSVKLWKLAVPQLRCWLKAVQLCLLATAFHTDERQQTSSSSSLGFLDQQDLDLLMMDWSAVTNALHLDCLLPYEYSRWLHLVLSPAWPAMGVAALTAFVIMVRRFTVVAPDTNGKLIAGILLVLDLTFIGTLRKVLARQTCVKADNSAQDAGVLLAAPFLECGPHTKASIAQVWNIVLGVANVSGVIFMRLLLAWRYRRLLAHHMGSAAQVSRQQDAAGNLKFIISGKQPPHSQEQAELAEEHAAEGADNSRLKERRLLQACLVAGHTAALHVLLQKRLHLLGCKQPLRALTWDRVVETRGAACSGKFQFERESGEAGAADAKHHITLRKEWAEHKQFEAVEHSEELIANCHSLKRRCLDAAWAAHGMHSCFVGCGFSALHPSSMLATQAIQLLSAALVYIAETSSSSSSDSAAMPGVGSTTVESQSRASAFVMVATAAALSLSGGPHVCRPTSVGNAVAFAAAALAALFDPSIAILAATLYYVLFLLLLFGGGCASPATSFVDVEGSHFFQMAWADANLEWQVTPPGRRETLELSADLLGALASEEIGLQEDAETARVTAVERPVARAPRVLLRPGCRIKPVRHVEGAVQVEVVAGPGDEDQEEASKLHRMPWKTERLWVRSADLQAQRQDMRFHLKTVLVRSWKCRRSKKKNGTSLETLEPLMAG